MQNHPSNKPKDKDPEGVSFYQFAALLVFIGLVITIILLFFHGVGYFNKFKGKL